jgi:RES domain-containing protein
VILWRISNYADLYGIGGLKASARWHSKGHRIVYLSSSPSSALLEILVYLEIEEDRLPRFYKLLEIQVPASIRIEKIEDWAKLQKGWQKRQASTRTLGDQWLEQNSSALLQIPSALVPHTNNFLLNPLHSDAAKLTIVSISRQGLDRRLLK